MPLLDAFHESAARRPAHRAIVCGSDAVTYAALRDEATRLARSIQELGLGPGDRVVVCLPNRRELVTAILATMHAGGVFVVVHPDVKPKKLAHVLHDCGARILVTHAAHRDADGSHDATILVDESEAEPTRGEHAFDRCTEAEPLECGDQPRPEDVCCLVYTSGSTGSGKGVTMEHAAATFAADAISDYLRLSEDDVVLNFTPLSADYGLYNVLMTLRRGGTVVLEPGYVFPTQILDAVRNHGVTGLALVPTIVAMFLAAKGIDGTALRGVRFVSSTGQVLPPAHIKRLAELMPQSAIYSMYGLTECKRVSYLDPAEVERRPDSVGKPMAGTEVFLADDEGAPLPAPAPGTRARGELVIRGPHLMRGYWNLQAETAARLRRDPLDPARRVLFSGDEFEMDDEGFLYFVARKDDLIKSSGERISPREIEDCIYGISGVTGVVVRGVPDPILGHALHATVATEDPTIDATRVRAHCAANLERALVPTEVEICRTIQETLTGKLTRPR